MAINNNEALGQITNSYPRTITSDTKDPDENCCGDVSSGKR
jgi:hypothetical protein